MATRLNVRRAIAVVAVAGAAAAGSALLAGTASAMPTDFNCTSAQIDTSLVWGDPGAGQRYGYVQFTAKPGVRCNIGGALPVSLADAPGVSVVEDDSPSQFVTIYDGESATMLLHWTGIEARADQVTPTSITVTAPSDEDLAGNVSDPEITLPWTLGPLDNAPEAHTLRVSAVTFGPAPAF